MMGEHQRRQRVAVALVLAVACALVSAPMLTATDDPIAAPRVVDSADDIGRSGWQRLWHPAFEAGRAGPVDLGSVDRVADRFAITGSDEMGAVAWWSDDGIEWVRSPSSRATERGVGQAVAGRPGAYVMVGWEFSPKGRRARTWHSVDGLAWKRGAIKPPGDSEAHDVMQVPDGRFIAFGDGDDRASQFCWAAISSDEGERWEVTETKACISDVETDGDAFVARAREGMFTSVNGIDWDQVVASDDIATLRGTWGRSAREGAPNLGVVPLGEGRYALAGHGDETLTWSQDDGLAMLEGLVDWTGFRDARLALGPDRAVITGSASTPWVTPPSGAYEDPPPERDVRCRPKKPDIADIVNMRGRERLACFGGRRLVFDAYLPTFIWGSECRLVRPVDWIACAAMPIAAAPGPTAGLLMVAHAPDARFGKGLKPGARVRVAGHFDDPLSRHCPATDYRPGPDQRPKWTHVKECRQHFVVTNLQARHDRSPAREP
jgi:hypothetical protein